MKRFTIDRIEGAKVILECEMKISFINIVSELKNMEDYKDRRFQIKRYD